MDELNGNQPPEREGDETPTSQFGSKLAMRPGIARFEIKASACQQVVARLLGLLAQQDRIADDMSASRDGEDLTVMIILPDIDDHRAHIMAEKMRSFIMVASVTLCFDEA